MYFVVDFENLFRGLSQTGGLNGVEVLMSMEEIPQAGAINLDTVVTGNNNNAAGNAAGAQQEPSNVGEGKHYLVYFNRFNFCQFQITIKNCYCQFLCFLNTLHFILRSLVYLAPIPWGGPPNAELLQNIVSSMIRQGLVPGVEGVTLHIPTQQNATAPVVHTVQNQGVPLAGIHNSVWAGHPQQLADQAAQAAAAQAVLSNQHGVTGSSGIGPEPNVTIPQRKLYYCEIGDVTT